MTLHKGYYI